MVPKRGSSRRSSGRRACAKLVGMKRGRRVEPALHDDASAVTQVAMTRSAEDPKAFVTAIEHGPVHGKRQCFGKLARRLAVVNNSSDHLPWSSGLRRGTVPADQGPRRSTVHRTGRWLRTARSEAGRTSRCGSRTERPERRPRSGPAAAPRSLSWLDQSSGSLFLGSFSAHLARKASFKRGPRKSPWAYALPEDGVRYPAQTTGRALADRGKIGCATPARNSAR